MAEKLERATILPGGDILTTNGGVLYSIENRVNPEYAEAWLLDHGFQKTKRVVAQIGVRRSQTRVFGLFEKPERPSVAIPEKKEDA